MSGKGLNPFSRTPLVAGVGMGREAPLFLLEQGVRVVGTDAWSWDAPFIFIAKRFSEEKKSSYRLGRS